MMTRRATNYEFAKYHEVLRNAILYLANTYPEACKPEAMYDGIEIDGFHFPGYMYCVREAIKGLEACKQLMFAGYREHVKEYRVNHNPWFPNSIIDKRSGKIFLNADDLQKKV